MARAAALRQVKTAPRSVYAAAPVYGGRVVEQCRETRGRVGYASPINRVPEYAPHVIADLPRSIQSETRALDLQRRDLSPLAGCLIVVHGRVDPIIPSARARRSRELRPTPIFISSIPLPTWLSDRATLGMR